MNHPPEPDLPGEPALRFGLHKPDQCAFCQIGAINVKAGRRAFFEWQVAAAYLFTPFSPMRFVTNDNQTVLWRLLSGQFLKSIEITVAQAVKVFDPGPAQDLSQYFSCLGRPDQWTGPDSHPFGLFQKKAQGRQILAQFCSTGIGQAASCIVNAWLKVLCFTMTQQNNFHVGFLPFFNPGSASNR
jgi:hypothetical protein